MSSKDELNISEWNISEAAVDSEAISVRSDEHHALELASQKNADLEAALRLTERRASDLVRQLAAVTLEATQQRRRIERDRDETIKHGNEVLIAELAPILDDLARAKAAGQRLGADAEPFVNGVRLVEERFVAVLARFGATVFSTQGEAFDPRRAEALGIRAAPSVPSGTVLEEHRRGVMLHERLIRPALVIVSTSEA